MSDRPNEKRTVLAVDDETLFGTALRRVLAGDYEFLHLTSASDALQRIQEGKRYDVIISDLLLPDLTGPRFYEELGRIDPHLCERVLFMTGGAGDRRGP